MLIRSLPFISWGLALVLSGCAATPLATKADGASVATPSGATLAESSSPLAARVESIPPAAVVGFAVEDRPWRLRNLPSSVTDRGGSMREAFIVLKSGTGRLEGNTGCNPIQGAYELKGAGLKIRNLEGSLFSCADGVTFEALFIQSLSDTTEWRERDGALVLFNADGDPLAVFDPALP
ncbi:MAG TPA: META domain-containing protein [Fluviicoccus sp.]|nr:META domain-containing protein [Fluviicoccus sp.]